MTKLCEYSRCSKHAKHNPSTKETKYCVAHGGGARCQHNGCEASAQRNPSTNETKYCIAHGGGARCQHEGCRSSAERDPSTNETKYCVKHGGGARCSVSGVHQFEEIPPFAKYKLANGDPACLFCLMNLEPSHDQVRTFINREVLILTEVSSRLPELAKKSIQFTCDETLGACSRKRPDMMWDFGAMVIWLEINERQHNTYSPRCEADRRNQIWQDIGNRPALLIEFNPDEYEDDNGREHRGMFSEKRTSRGEKRLRPNADEFERRMQRLVEELCQGLRRIEDTRSDNISDGIEQRFLFYTPSVESKFRLA